MEATARTIWGLGDYHRFAQATVWGLGPCWCKRAASARDSACSTWPTSPSAPRRSTRSLAFAERANRGAPGGPAEYPYEYLLAVARKR